MSDRDADIGRRCSVANDKDPTPCEGSLTAVTLITREGGEITGCVQHSVRQLASLKGSRLHPMAALMPWVIDIYCRAAELTPFPWELGL